MSEPHQSSIEEISNRASVGGVEHAGIIDVLEHNTKTDEVTLRMIERRPWDGSELRLFQLQEKINAYLSFILDGEMAEVYPSLQGKPMRLVLECVGTPDAMTQHFLRIVRDQIAFQGIQLQVEPTALHEGRRKKDEG